MGQLETFIDILQRIRDENKQNKWGKWTIKIQTGPI
jgi:hypothetical protein